MGFDRVLNGGYQLGRVAGVTQKAARGLGREPGGSVPLRRTLRNHHAIVEPGGRQHDLESRIFRSRELLSIGNYPADMSKVMYCVK
jgi:hypothetical protein